MEPTAPAITISDPVLLKSGKYKVEVTVSDKPGLIHEMHGGSPIEADRMARHLKHSRLNKFYKSRAAHHARIAGKLARDLRASADAREAGEAA